jgi:prophage maintenance system killer protein
LKVDEDKDLYPDLFAKTAALMDSLVRNHPFVVAISAQQLPPPGDS